MRIDHRTKENTDLGPERVAIFLDGERIDDRKPVFFADEEAGEVGFYLLDENGKRYLDPDDPTEPARQFVFGQVEIRGLNPDGNKRLAERRDALNIQRGLAQP